MKKTEPDLLRLSLKVHPMDLDDVPEEFGISVSQWERLERGGQIQTRAMDNYMRLLFDESENPDLRRTSAQCIANGSGDEQGEIG